MTKRSPTRSQAGRSKAKKSAPRRLAARAIGNRNTNGRRVGRRWLVACEGACTEPYYFRAFGPHVALISNAGNTVSVVEALLAHPHFATVNERWAVFDRDSFDTARFTRAFDLARANGINIAWSNQAFELWYILHYDFVDTYHHRDEYRRLLTERLGHRYQKNDPGMFNRLLPMVDTAIRNAQRLQQFHGVPPHGTTHPINARPCTTVDQLVARLLAEMRRRKK